jgi:hypothetical protein
VTSAIKDDLRAVRPQFGKTLEDTALCSGCNTRPLRQSDPSVQVLQVQAESIKRPITSINPAASPLIHRSPCKDPALHCAATHIIREQD